ncbi:hypothetical protein AAOE16_00120 [Ekhidna sp. MALMAid0563]|uniref:hypothetical protein n=1 Tax=Ekhidna sp. MALMAid0563 TaxID=3143937 RepID=UPI0032DF5B29
MKYLILLIILAAFSCNSESTTDYRWIRSYSDETLQGARWSVEGRKYNEDDSLIIAEMARVRSVISNLYDSIPHISMKEILRRTAPLIEDMKFGKKKIEEYYSLTENSTDEDLKLQLALLEFELLNNYVKQIGMRDVTFDTVELRFIPSEISSTRITGELHFLASSNNLENEAKMYVNDQEIPIDGRRGIVDISRDQLNNGSFNARIEFGYAYLDLETNIEVIKE